LAIKNVPINILDAKRIFTVSCPNCGCGMVTESEDGLLIKCSNCNIVMAKRNIDYEDFLREQPTIH